MTDIPRKLSVNDPDFNPLVGAGLIVFLDGTPQSFVISYDMDAGTITRHQTDNRGNVFLSGDEFATEMLSGVVTVKRKP